MEFLKLFLLFLIIAGLAILVVHFWHAAREMNARADGIWSKSSEISKLNRTLTEKNEQLLHENERLRPYSELADADTYVARRTKEGEAFVLEAKEEAKRIRESQKARSEEAENVSKLAQARATQIVDEARLNAEEIAGKAYYALENTEMLEATASAMKDIINGYGDQYLLDTESWVDSLAKDWDHKDAGRELIAARLRTKQMIDGDHAAQCDYKEARRSEIAVKFVIDAFNGKVDSIFAKARQDNYGRLKKQIEDAYQLVNFHGKAFRDARINKEFLDARLWELYWIVGAKELEKRHREEQQEIKRAIREEARAQREYQKALKDAEKEEKLLEKALNQARAELQVATEEDSLKLQEQLSELEEKLRKAEEKNQRALSMAQQTKRGHVYIISNVGSFGDNTFKIGLTRRLEPLDRVKELGDASVPFSFDVHAMIYSEDAPDLERELHKIFEAGRVNKVNRRKEFFSTSLLDIRKAIENKDVKEVHWTLEAEAREYRETRALMAKAQGDANKSPDSDSLAST
ncbi:DUF4041 domain-containing protein [Verrucomicrobiales bacterium]|nr:DUF4041 domain-containing protein [Verrucomicrobiales bacterium]